MEWDLKSLSEKSYLVMVEVLQNVSGREGRTVTPQFGRRTTCSSWNWILSLLQWEMFVEVKVLWK